MNITHEVQRILAEKRIELPQGSHGFVDPRIRFEAPVTLHATLKLDGVLQVGAFTGVYGGQLRHAIVGRYCSVAPGLQCGWDEHPTNRLSSSMAGYVPDVHGWASFMGADPNRFRSEVVPFQSIRGITRIGHDVWIGHSVFIRTGVSIGDGAIVAAGSVVTRDIPPYTIAAGVPARVIKERFPGRLIDRFLRVRWWRYSIFDIPPRQLSDTDAALDWIEERSASGHLQEYRGEIVDAETLLSLWQGMRTGS